MKKQESEPILVSSCLVGLCTRYDGQIKPSEECLEQLRGHTWIPVCPEQLGGLPTPRPAADLVGGDGTAVLDGWAAVITKDGEDVTANFIRGAAQCLEVVRAQGVRLAFLRAKSPSCGLGPLKGVTAAMLEKNGVELREF